MSERPKAGGFVPGARRRKRDAEITDMGEIIKSLSESTATASVKKLRKATEKLDSKATEDEEPSKVKTAMTGMMRAMEKEMFGDPGDLGLAKGLADLDATAALAILDTVGILIRTFERMAVKAADETGPAKPTITVREACGSAAAALSGLHAVLRGHWNLRTEIPHEPTTSPPAESKTATPFMRGLEAMGVEGDSEGEDPEA